MTRGATLVFVYDADSGVFNALTGAAHKIFSPRPYACNLCALTYGAVQMRGEWREFLGGLGLPLEFLHADESAARYDLNDVPLPAVFTKGGGGLSVLASADSSNACLTLDEPERPILEGRARRRPFARALVPFKLARLSRPSIGARSCR